MLHIETVTPTLLNIITKICAEPFFKSFRLVGGTALSLEMGHRMSVDADFFTNETFDKDEAIRVLLSIFPQFMVLKSSSHGFAATYQGVKMDIYTWGVPFLLPVKEEEGIRLADIRDIAALKLEAIIQRKEEKDFRDVQALLQLFSLSELIDFFKERYPHQSPKILTEHLLAATFVERDLSINLIKDIAWEKIGFDIENSVKNFYQSMRIKKEEIEQQNLQKRIDEIQKRKK
jgi:Nucleotidyl transferase AbiEii toxin, Type IV TA system